MKKDDVLTLKITDPKDYQFALNIRRKVFIVEQNVPEEIEIDEYEREAQHFLTKFNGTPAATGRLRVKEKYIKFERIATLKEFRGQGVGKNLMDTMLAYAREHYSHLLPYMHSQADAIPFYEKLGWTAQGDVFYEANIPHQAMVKLSSKNER